MKGTPLPHMQSQTSIHGFLDKIFPVGLNPFYPDVLYVTDVLSCLVGILMKVYEIGKITEQIGSKIGSCHVGTAFPHSFTS